MELCFFNESKNFVVIRRTDAVTIVVIPFWTVKYLSKNSISGYCKESLCISPSWERFVLFVIRMFWWFAIWNTYGVIWGWHIASMFLRQRFGWEKWMPLLSRKARLPWNLYYWNQLSRKDWYVRFFPIKHYTVADLHLNFWGVFYQTILQFFKKIPLEDPQFLSIAHRGIYQGPLADTNFKEERMSDEKLLCALIPNLCICICQPRTPKICLNKSLRHSLASRLKGIKAPSWQNFETLRRWIFHIWNECRHNFFMITENQVPQNWSGKFWKFFA